MGNGSSSLREREVLSLIAEGLSSKEIARALGISPRTAECHTDHIRSKLGIRKRSRMAALVAMRDIDGLL
jgi:DNA-binding CsgD family transcriptional regulator